jgi:enoyl-CoA hydratase/carnithine racemase
VEVLTLLRDLDQPTVAAVHGPAIGAGWGLALMCDCCFASPEARFALPEIAKGFRLPSVIIRRLVEVVGPIRAAELVLGGRSVLAAEALAVGVVSRVLDAADLAQTAHAFATTLAAHDPARVSAAAAALRVSTAAAPEFPWIDEGIS